MILHSETRLWLAMSASGHMLIYDHCVVGQVIALLEREISSSAWFGVAFLVDGFPRTLSQAEKFEQQVRPCDVVLYFECPEKLMLERLGKRGKSSGREDDSPAIIKKRLKAFQRQTLPAVKFYQDARKLHMYALPFVAPY